MALVACKECGTEISSRAETCPKCGVKIASKGMGCGTLIVVLVVGAVIVSAVSDRSSKTPNASSHSSNSPTASSTPAPKTAEAPWSYRNSKDAMGKGANYQAEVSSTNTENFGFPYAGPQHATLTLRTHARYGKDIIFSIEKGQVLCHSYEDCTVLVRFDDEKAVNYAGIGAADHSTTTVFIRNYARFLEKPSKARRVRISVNIYQQGAPVFDFDVSGFDQNQYRPTK